MLGVKDDAARLRTQSALSAFDFLRTIKDRGRHSRAYAPSLFPARHGNGGGEAISFCCAIVDDARYGFSGVRSCMQTSIGLSTFAHGDRKLVSLTYRAEPLRFLRRLNREMNRDSLRERPNKPHKSNFFLIGQLPIRNAAKRAESNPRDGFPRPNEGKDFLPIRIATGREARLPFAFSGDARGWFALFCRNCVTDALTERFAIRGTVGPTGFSKIKGDCPRGGLGDAPERRSPSFFSAWGGTDRSRGRRGILCDLHDDNENQKRSRVQ